MALAEVNPMFFHDRAEAANLLANKLAQYKGQHPLVLAIPRGAVPMAKIIADELEGELDVVLVAKIPAPMNPEVAIGAIAENGWAHIAEWAFESGATPEYIEEQIELLLKKIHDRRNQYSALHPPISCKDRIVIVVDDGLATGATMISALHSVREMEPKELVMAVPVSPPQALDDVKKHADVIVFLVKSTNFHAVGQFYERFPQVSDEEVIEILQTKH